LALSDLFSRLKRVDPNSDTGATSSAPVSPTKALGKFVAGLAGREAPVLLDLGPVIGGNVSFFGERLGCKIVVEDIAKDIDRHVTERRLAELPRFFETRVAREDESVDGILCWDLFDFLDKNSAVPLARQLTRCLRPGGLVFAFFNTHELKQGTTPPPAVYTKYVVVEGTKLQQRPYAAARGKQRPFQNRDIQKMFEPLRITHQFLLKSHMREVLFRKPMPGDPPAPPTI
jgi:hypothetical protein